MREREHKDHFSMTVISLRHGARIARQKFSTHMTWRSAANDEAHAPCDLRTRNQRRFAILQIRRSPLQKSRMTRRTVDAPAQHYI